MRQEHLISLNCPNCGSTLNCDETSMKAVCNFCGTEFLISDFITERRIDNSDRLSNYKPLAENAFNAEDYNQAYKYYKKICEIESSDKNLAYLNVSGVLSGKLALTESVYKTFYVFTPDEHRKYLIKIQESINQQFYNEKSKIDSKVREKAKHDVDINQLNAKYRPVFVSLSNELKKLQPLKCVCGGILQRDDTICPQCGKNRADILKELAAAKKKKTIILIVVFAVIVIVVGTIGIVKNANDKNMIRTSIENGEYSHALEMIEDYSGNKTAEVYIWQADCYIGLGDLQKALDVVESGLGRVSSDEKAKLMDKKAAIEDMIEKKKK